MARVRTPTEQEIAKALIETKGIDFENIGAVISKYGATAALAADGDDFFCGVNRIFIRIFRVRDVVGPVEELGELQRLGATVRG